MNATGINTADITKVIAIMAPLISFIACCVASLASKCSSSILACTASTTTMALSTTIPMAKTRANSVIKLIEKPNNCIKKNVPIRDTGTAIAGINVERKSPKKINTISATNKKASTNVRNTSCIEASKKLDTS